MDRKTFEDVSRQCGAKVDGNKIWIEDEDLKELSPFVMITSLESAVQEVATFASVSEEIDVENLFKQIWGDCEHWGSWHWSIFDQTERELTLAWKNFAIQLLLADRKC